MKKIRPLRDPAYLRDTRLQRCIITGLYATPDCSVVPAHIGTLGKGIKNQDNWVLPVLQSIHLEMHARGEIDVLRELLPNDVLRAAVQAYCEKLYERWRAER